MPNFTLTPIQVFCRFEYRLVKTPKHPEVKLQKLKERWDKLKDKGTHVLWKGVKGSTTLFVVSEVYLSDWESFDYKILEKQSDLKKIDKTNLPVGTMTQYGRIQGRAEASESSSTNYKVHGSPTELCNSIRVKILPSTEWTYWDGGVSSPVPSGLQVEFKIRNGKVNSTENAAYLTWEHELRSDDIIAYRIVGISQGWTD